MPSFELTFLRFLLSMLDAWPELKQAVSTCTSSEEAGRVVVSFLQRPDLPEKLSLLEQTFALALAHMKPAWLGTEVGIACHYLFEPEQFPRARDDETLNDWRGDATCALLVRIIKERDEPHGGLAWANDLPRKGYPTVADGRMIEGLHRGKDYELASLTNTTLEQVANFCDVILERECSTPTSPCTLRPHRALAGVLFPLLGRARTHAVLFRMAQVGSLGSFSPALYPLGKDETERKLAYHARICDARASQSLGLPSSWHPYYINHLALAGLLADAIGVEMASACMSALDEQGTMTRLEPAHVGLPNGGEDREWQWRCDGPAGPQNTAFLQEPEEKDGL